jgi:CheY-like chemotaxis protein
MVERKLLYVVDDDEIFHFIVKRMLESRGNNLIVTSFLSAEDALEQLAVTEQPPSLILLDINMQSMSGWEFIEAFRKINNAVSRNIPIIMCSSSIDMRDMQKVQGTPELRAYITKPLDVQKMKMIEEYL